MDRFKDCVCPDCAEYFEGEFTPCDLGDPFMSDTRRSQALERYAALVAEGKLIPAW